MTNRAHLGRPGLVGRSMPAACLGVAAFLAGSCSGPADPDAPPAAPRVVVVCIEALRYDDPDRGEMPSLGRLINEGARVNRLVPVFPTNAGPNQAAVATGRRADGHGIINNIFLERATNEEFEGDPDHYEAMLLAEPLWTSAVRAGIPAATINWDGGTVAFDDVAPTRLAETDDARDVNDIDRVDELIGWLDERGDVVPRLMMLYIEDYDDLGHQNGPENSATIDALERVDEQIERIEQAIRRNGGPEHTTLFVFGDHGMGEATECIYLQAYLKELGHDVRSLSSGATSNVYLEKGTDPVAVKTLLEAQGDSFDVYLPDELPADWGCNVEGRTGDLVLVGRGTTYFRDRGGRSQPVGNARLPGIHGYPPERADMQTACIAWGRGVPAGTTWDERSILDLYPTMRALLGLDPDPEAPGEVLPGMAAPAATTAP